MTQGTILLLETGNVGDNSALAKVVRNWASPSRISTKQLLLVRFSPFQHLIKTNSGIIYQNLILYRLFSYVKNAEKGGYAIGAFNVYNLEGVEAVVAAAEAENSPAILQVRNFNMLILRNHMMHKT